ncbi:uncharacterized protein LDX57_008121 [Aspergillus melleus]|uniref:uncharacterized protein n=1 Tax=Aspergillus melleus TaxID=138277 RepID=UPI001E8D5AF9|nr:uncharacterized protein LDX57_008121 [Aspergillus melleus]KAH8430462.1 hypothetical protein LDX57_008121 [Aspergillus melleus]
MRLPPPEVLMSWPTPNYTDPPTRGNSAFIVNVVGTSLAFVVTCLRLYTRLRITCSPGFDDILIVIALIFAIGMCAVISMATEQWGWDRHMWDVPLEWIPTNSKLNLSFQLLFSLASSITKLSVLWFCKRLLGRGSKGLYRWYNVVLIVAMVFVTICCTLFTVLSIFQCKPIHAYWDFMPKYPHHCMNDGYMVFSASVVNIFTDFLATVLPMPLIWNLKLPARQRIAVISIFGLGIVVNVAGSIRTVYVWKSMVASYDTTWLGWPVLLAATIEISIGLICASAPALRPLIAFFLPRLLQSSRNYASYDQQNPSQKLWGSTGRSKNSKHESRHYGNALDRMEVVRTVEMETWTESRDPSDAMENNAGVKSNHTRVATPTHKFELKDSGTVITSPGSDGSTISLTRESLPESPFGDRSYI